MEPAQTPKSKILARLLSSTREQARDTGMAMVLICLLLDYFRPRPEYLPLAIGLLVLTMVWPSAFKPLAVLWFGLSQVLGNLVSRIILSLLFFVLVTPIGLIRRLLGADSLQLKKWKKDRASVFVERQGVIRPEDLANPY
jgi:hypothetical protein